MSSPPVPVDQAVWMACAGGGNVKIPSVGSCAFYFPEQCKKDAGSSGQPNARMKVQELRCRVMSIRYMVDPDTDDIFARISLDPNLPPMEAAGAENHPPEALARFLKVLTPTDAISGRGLTVPKADAATVFPSLDLGHKNPSQLLDICDLAGRVFSFRHVYYTTGSRHRLTTGWQKFVDDKKLVAGDRVIFIKKSPQEIRVGLRRKDPLVRGDVQSALEEGVLDEIFSVDYYPRKIGDAFLVDEAAVTDAMRVAWRPGMRVRMMVETEDPGKESWHEGTVEGVDQVGPRVRKILKIKWDYKDDTELMSPWQVVEVMAEPGTGIGQDSADDDPTDGGNQRNEFKLFGQIIRPTTISS